ALVKAIDDRDPWVRRSACQAITTILPAAYLATGPEVDSANELWGVLFAHAGDEHPAVRRAVALGLAWYGQAAEGDEPLPSSLTAVTSLSADADQETARLAASFYLGRTSAPGAAAALRALVKATPKSISLDTDELLPTEWETAVATLIAVDPESYSLDELLAFATGPEETHSAWIALAATAAIVKRDDAALTRFLDAVARDPGRWQADVFMSALDWADETQAAEGEPTRLSPADVRAVLAFLDRLDRDQPAQATLILTLLSEVAEYGAEALGNPFPEWVKEAGGRPGLRYAALEATIDFSEDVRPALESDDAVACLIAASLVFDEVASGPPPAWLREGSPRLKAIAQEGLRRAIQNGHVEQPGL
ncbi:MAG TPA: HEAT repeat domain-containing protein, partial [Pirellulales bacterium]